MEFGHENGNFSWDASIVLSPGGVNYNKVSQAYANPAGRTLEFDVIWTAADLNSSPFTFANLSFSLQDDNAFRQVDSLAQITTPQDSVIHVALPLDSGNLAGGIGGSGFYRLTYALNTDFTFPSTSSVRVDNLFITPEPGTFLLAGLSGGLLLVRRRK